MTCSRRAGPATHRRGASTWRLGRLMTEAISTAAPARQIDGAPVQLDASLLQADRVEKLMDQPSIRRIWRNAALRSPPLPTPRTDSQPLQTQWSVVSGVRSSCAATVRKFSRTTRASSAAWRARSLECREC